MAMTGQLMPATTYPIVANWAAPAKAIRLMAIASIGEKPPVVRAVSPIDRNIVLGEFPQADAALVDEAVNAARAAFPPWRDMRWPKRVELLRAAADILEERKWDVSVACLVEVGKSRLEAVGEVEEAIDLIRHYCAEMERTDGFREERPGASSAERCIENRLRLVDDLGEMLFAFEALGVELENVLCS